VWVQEPRSTTELTRASTSDYHDYAAPPTSLTPDLGCLTTPAVTGPVHATTLTGYVKIFSSNPPGGTLGVTVQVFRVDTTTGALMGQVGSPYTTSKSDPVTSNHWLYNCETDACAFYGYTITGVPTETPLVIETSDGGPGLWANLYDYNIYFSDAVDCASAPTGAPCVSSATTTSYDVTAVVPADISTAATLAGGFTLNPTQGVIAGEVHDCGDVRIAGANVDLDKPYVGPLIYFDANETQPTPDEDIGQADEGTSLLGLFGALDLATGAPIRVSAIGNVSGKDTLLGTAIVQAYPGPSVTAITLRGRGPYQ